MKKNLFYAGIICLAAFSSCKDEGKGPEYPVKYNLDMLGYISPVRMFSAQGEIHDQNVIEKYKNRYPNLKVINQAIGYPNYLTLHSEDSLQFRGEFSKRAIKKIDGKVELVSPYTMMLPVDPDFTFFNYSMATMSPHKIEISVANLVVIMNGPETRVGSSRYEAGGVLVEIDESAINLKVNDTLAFVSYKYICESDRILDE